MDNPGTKATPQSKTIQLVRAGTGREWHGTPLSRQGYLPDLEPLLQSKSHDDLGERLFVPRSKSSPGALRHHDLSHVERSKRKGDCLEDDLLLASSHYHDRTGLWGTVWNMSSATLGAGALSLPYAFQQLGVIGGMLALLVTATAAHFSVILLIAAIAATGAKSYEELTVHCFGKRMGFFVELNILIFCFGSVIAYTVTVGDILEPLLATKTVRAVAPWLDRQLVMCLFWAACMLPLSLVQRLSALQCSSLFGVCSLFYLVLSVVAHALLTRVYGHTDDLRAEVSALYGRNDGVLLFSAGPTSLEALAIITFAFTMQVNIPSLYEELPRRTPWRMGLVSGRCMSVCGICYMLVGLAGYRDAPRSPNGNLLGNYCVTSTEPTSRIMQIAFVAMTFTVVMAFPLNIHPCRYTLDVLLYERIGWIKDSVRHVVLTLFIAGSGLLIALYVPGLARCPRTACSTREARIARDPSSRAHRS